MKTLLFLLAAVGVFLLGGWWWRTRSAAEPNVEALAQCLASKSVVMYGADWCSHCQDEKKLFGSSFSKMTYVECTKEEALCQEKGIEAYPTWDFGDGRKVEGALQLADLAQEAGCTF